MGGHIWFILLAAVPLSNAIQFFARQGEEVCVQEAVIEADSIIGSFVISPSNSRIGVTVKDPLDKEVYSKSAISEGQFAFTSSTAGEYRICFLNSGLNQKTVSGAHTSHVHRNTIQITTLQVKFDLKKGAQAKDYSVLAKAVTLFCYNIPAT